MTISSLPEFTAAATSGLQVQSNNLIGNPLILYFYPKDSTPGCTRESVDFAAVYPELKELGVQIYGVSRDSLKSHENFRAKQNLPFELISDADQSLCEAFDVIREKNMYGRKVMGIERSTFLFDREGKLAREWRKLRVPGHVEEVMRSVKELA